MCLVVFGLNTHEKYRLVFVANRDEFFKRPTQPAHEWVDSGIIAGKDLEADGTWMGVNKKGKLAAITNYRDLKNLKKGAPSRGMLTRDFLESDLSIIEYLEKIKIKAAEYNGFNLLLADKHRVIHYSNVSKVITEIEDGIHGLSNALLDTPWPKVKKVKSRLKDAMRNNSLNESSLINMISDKELAADEELPDTGVPFELEKQLSSMYIRIPGYGTRCTTVVKISKQGFLEYTEVAYNEAGELISRNEFSFQVE